MKASTSMGSHTDAAAQLLLTELVLVDFSDTENGMDREPFLGPKALDTLGVGGVVCLLERGSMSKKMEPF